MAKKPKSKVPKNRDRAVATLAKVLAEEKRLGIKGSGCRSYEADGIPIHIQGPRKKR